MNFIPLRASTTFGQLSQGRDNNFDFLRFFFATCVIFSHSWACLYNNTWYAYDPLLHLTKGQYAFGGGAVDGFFLISGFLVTKSWVNSSSASSYTRKRALRILPALVVVLVVTVFVLGPLGTTNIGQYFRSGATYKYLALMLEPNLQSTDRLPGVFTHNSEQFRVNGSLWTIRFELICYGMVAICGVLAWLKKPRLIAVLAFLVLAQTIGPFTHLFTFGQSVDDLFRLVAYFMFGMLFYLYRDKIPFSPVLLLASLVALVVADLVRVLPFAAPFLFGYALFFVAFSKAIKLHHFAKYGDFSYGIYLYAFPIQQLLVEHFPQKFNAYSLTAVSFVLTLGCAVISWHFVEQPFLRLKSKPRVHSVQQEPAAAVPEVA